DRAHRGTEEIHATAEWFHTWFTFDARRALGVDWETWYWIAYSGIGSSGFGHEVFSEWSGYHPDLGLGFESSFRAGHYLVFLSGVVAHGLDSEGDLNAHLT